MKSQPITEEVKKAIWDWYREENLTQIEIGKLIGVASPSISDWLNGNAKTIRPRNWEKLYPHIKQYLPPDCCITSGDSSPIVNGHHAIGINNGTITQSCLDSVIDKIISNPELSDAEKIKFIKVLKK